MKYRTIRTRWFFAVLAVVLPAAGPARAVPVKLSLSPGYGSVLRSERITLPMKVSLEGASLPETAQRPKANVAIVIDRSGSMAGEKIEQARNAAIAALSFLSPDDIVSVVAYDDKAEVIVPATRLTAKHDVIARIKRIGLGGNTGLFAGVSTGAAEVSKFREPNRVNRIILLSDGLANVGPSNPAQLGDLGASLKKDGVAVSTIGIGLGYNEDLMTQLAQRSDGNHVFAERATDLALIFQREFGDILSVVAQDVTVEVTCRNGVRPVRVIGRDAEIYGNRILTKLNQVYSGQEKYLIFEAEVDPAALGADGTLAAVELDYWDPIGKQRMTISGSRSVGFVDSRAAMEQSVDRPTFTAYYTQLATVATDEAIALADKGRRQEAASVLNRSAESSRVMSKKFNIPELEKQASQSATQGELIEKAPYGKARKQIQYENFMEMNQQSRY